MARQGTFEGTWREDSSGSAGPVLVVVGVVLLVGAWLAGEWQKASAVRAEAEAREAEALARMPAPAGGGAGDLIAVGVVGVVVVAVAVGFAVAAWSKLRQVEAEQPSTVTARVERAAVEGQVIHLPEPRPVAELEASQRRHPAGRRLTPMQLERVRREARRR